MTKARTKVLDMTQGAPGVQLDHWSSEVCAVAILSAFTLRAVYHDGQARSKMHPVRDTVRICLWSVAFRYLRA